MGEKTLSKEQVEDLRIILDFASANLAQAKTVKQSEIQQIQLLQQKIAGLNLDETDTVRK